jgi:hypothetical protein
MKRSRKAVHPAVEQCESRALLSGGLAASPGAAAAAARGPIIRIIELGGTIHGHYTWNLGVPDAGGTYILGGSGKVHGIGKTDLAGNLHSIGFIAKGHAGGTLVLAGARGTITLSMTGAEQIGGPTSLPENFTFQITDATGKYKNVADQGTAKLMLARGSSTTAMNSATHGTFKLVLTSFPVPV